MAKKDFDIKIEINIPKKEYEMLRRFYYFSLLPLNFIRFVNEFNSEQKKPESDKDKFKKINIK